MFSPHFSALVCLCMIRWKDTEIARSRGPHASLIVILPTWFLMCFISPSSRLSTLSKTLNGKVCWWKPLLIFVYPVWCCGKTTGRNISHWGPKVTRHVLLCAGRVKLKEELVFSHLWSLHLQYPPFSPIHAAFLIGFHPLRQEECPVNKATLRNFLPSF